MAASYYVEEACYYLTRLKLNPEEIGKQFNISPEQVANAVKQYEEKLSAGMVSLDENTQQFWSMLLRESAGDEKITLVDEKGRYYHGWRTELERLPTENLVELLVVNKGYSDKHPLSEFSKTQPIVGYDPLIPLRNIRKTVSLLDDILQKREANEKKEEHAVGKRKSKPSKKAKKETVAMKKGSTKTMRPRKK